MLTLKSARTLKVQLLFSSSLGLLAGCGQTPATFNEKSAAVPQGSLTSPQSTVGSSTGQNADAGASTSTDQSENSGAGKVQGQLSIDPAEGKSALGYQISFQATFIINGVAKDVTKDVVWDNDNKDIGSIDAKGIFSSVKAGGPANISATYGALAAVAHATVSAAVLKSIVVSAVNPSLPIGVSTAVSATAQFSDGSLVDVTSQATWNSSNSTVANVTLDAGGKATITAVTKGDTKITATLNQTTATTTIAVIDAKLVSIQASPSPAKVAAGMSVPFQAWGNYSDNVMRDVTDSAVWASSDSSTFKFGTQAGKPASNVSIKKGDVTVSIDYQGLHAAVQVNVSNAVTTSLVITPNPVSIPLGLTQSFIVKANLSDGSQADVTASTIWASSDSTVLSVSNAAGSQGLVSSIGKGAADVKGTYDGQSATASVNVISAKLQSIEIAPANGSVAAGLTLAFTATGKYSDNSSIDLTNSVMWDSSNPTAATISNMAGSYGLASGKAVGSTKISGIVSGVKGSASLNVVTAVLQSISISPMDVKLKAGASQAFKATGSYSDGVVRDITDSVVWSSSAPTVASISNSAPDKGLATLSRTANGVTLIDATIGKLYAKTSLTGFTDSMVQVNKVGFNFEDLLLTNSDHDFNDSVLCTTGQFMMQGDKVFSKIDQTVKGSITVLSGCRHLGKVQIYNADGSLSSEINYDDSNTTSVNIGLKANQELRVLFKAKANCTTADKYYGSGEQMNVLANVCNLTGN